MKLARTLIAALWMGALAGASAAAERSLDKQVEVAASLDQAWDACTTR